jgi:hypothetical protein
MGSIQERNHASGRTTWKICLRKRGIATFCITFDELEEACDWIEKNEKEFYKDPDKYFRWREEFYYETQRTRNTCQDHILRPKNRKKKEL